MRQLSHVASLVELGWVDFVDSILFDLLLGAIVTLHEQLPACELFDHPSSDESVLGVVQPDIALAGKVVLALYDPPWFRDVWRVFRDELRCKGANGYAVAVRVRA